MLFDLWVRFFKLEWDKWKLQIYLSGKVSLEYDRNTDEDTINLFYSNIASHTKCRLRFCLLTLFPKIGVFFEYIGTLLTYKSVSFLDVGFAHILNGRFPRLDVSKARMYSYNTQNFGNNVIFNFIIYIKSPNKRTCCILHHFFRKNLYCNIISSFSQRLKGS